MKSNQIAHTINNPFSTVGEMCSHLNVINSREEPWRLVNSELGQINGLPLSRGKIVASNGIYCIILLQNGQSYRGHHAWWTPDPCTSQPNISVPSARSTVKQTLLYAGF